MKALFILSVVIFSLKAQAGAVSCVTESGELFTAQLDGEAQLTDLQLIDARNNVATKDLEVDSIDLTNNQMTLRFSGFWDPETPFRREIKVDGLNVLTSGTYGEFDVQAPFREQAQCVVLFEPGE